ncbi:MAG: glycine cleavage system protein R [Chloroflexota bacterium]
MSESREQFVISIMSRDRVGIIYEISKALSELGGNIADVRQSVLSGYFTMILLASFPSKVTKRAVERKLAEVDANSETVIESAVKRIEAGDRVLPSTTPENAYVLTASGIDRVGIVAQVSYFCVAHNINILYLSTTVSDGAYVMILALDLDHCGSISQVRSDLQELARETGLKLVLQHYDIFRAVNEINLPVR